MIRFLRCFVLSFALAGLSFAQTTLTATPASLSFTWQQGTTLPAAQTVSIKSGSSTAAFVTAIVPSSDLWLTVSLNGGNLPASISVTVNPTGLAAGQYTASVQLTAAGFAAPILIPVTVDVEPPLPNLILGSTSVSFTAPPSSPAPQSVTLSTTGGPISFTAAVQGASWLTLTPASGIVLPGVPVTLTLTASSKGLIPQSAPYSGKVVLTATGVPSANKTQNIPVTLLVNAVTPTITNLWPSAMLAGSGALAVTIFGTEFYSATTAKVTGSSTALKTVVISNTALQVLLPATLTATAGALNLVVTNPAPGGDSTPAVFTVSATPVVQAVVDAASYSNNPVSPGEIVALFGNGIGPATPMGMAIANGFVTQTLENVSVTIDGQACPLVFVSQNQINVAVPYAATIGTARAVVVNNKGTQAVGQVDIQATSPGLFSADGSGTGQAAALTFSMTTGLYSLNGSASPVHANDLIILYLTGEGDYATSINPRTGYIVPANTNPLPQVNPLPTVTIGGQPATVQYAGPMGGGMLGVLQMNVVVPSGSTTGNSTPVSVTIGGVSTQAGMTIAVK